MTYKKQIFLIIVLFSIFGWAKSSQAATINASSCSLTDVTTAHNVASTGDTVSVPAGDCTWSSALTVSKALSIIGAGSGGGGTKLTLTGSMPNGAFHITGFSSSNLMRISGFYLEMTNWTPYTAIAVDSITDDNVRIDNNVFNQGAHAILFYNPKGLIDHNYFYNGNLTIEYSSGSRADADASWVSMAAGTVNATFIEDNHFIDDANYPASYSDERIGTFNGGKLVVRYNEFDADNIPDIAGTYYPFMAHGSADGGCGGAGYWESSSCQRRGQSVIEFYNNVEHGKRIDYLYISRGSANLIYNNAITGTVRYNPRIMLSEEEYISDNWSVHRIAWPAEDQVHNTFIWNNTYRGHDFNDGTYGYIETYPTNYDCTANGIPMSCCTGSGTGTCGDNSKLTSNPFIRQNRDYFLHAPCGASDTNDAYGNLCTHGKETFTGANGASGSYPTDGIKYPTLGTMVFSGQGDNAYYGYTPYTYPHPLTLAGSPSPPPDTTPPAAPTGVAVN